MLTACVNIFREDAWRRAAPEDTSSWRESRREDAEREDRRGDRDERRGDRDERRGERQDRDRRDDREPRGPVRSQEEGKPNIKTLILSHFQLSKSQLCLNQCPQHL